MYIEIQDDSEDAFNVIQLTSSGVKTSADGKTRFVETEIVVKSCTNDDQSNKIIKLRLQDNTKNSLIRALQAL